MGVRPAGMLMVVGSLYDAPNPVRPEPVEGPHFCSCGSETKQGFDKLSPNGVWK
jgi:hypothetical protein